LASGISGSHSGVTGSICTAVCGRVVTEIPKDIVPEFSNSSIPRKMLRVHNTGDLNFSIFFTEFY
jgi:hypothetical protein